MGAINSIKTAHTHTCIVSPSPVFSSWSKGGPALPLTFSHIDIDHALTQTHRSMLPSTVSRCTSISARRSCCVWQKICSGKNRFQTQINTHTHRRKMHGIRCIVFGLCVNVAKMKSKSKGKKPSKSADTTRCNSRRNRKRSRNRNRQHWQDKQNQRVEWWTSPWATTMVEIYILRVDCKIPLNQIAILPFTFAVRDVCVCTLAQAFICFPLQ